MAGGRHVTLIELLMVMIIIAILSVTLFISLSGNLEDARQSAEQDAIANVNAALRGWQAGYLRDVSVARQVPPYSPAGFKNSLATNPDTLLYWAQLLDGSIAPGVRPFHTYLGDFDWSETLRLTIEVRFETETPDARRFHMVCIPR